MERDNEIIIANEDLLTKEFHEQYKENGNGMDKYEFYCEFFYCTPINGDIYYSNKNDAIEFEYRDWNTRCTYDHIELCLEWLEEDSNKYKDFPISGFDKSTLFHVLMALNSCGAIGKREYEALHKKYCSYGK